MVSASKVVDFADFAKNYDPRTNITRNVLNKYEHTKVLGMRMEQLARNAPPRVPIATDAPFDAYAIARRELAEKKLPFWIVRSLPNGQKEYWKLEDLEVLKDESIVNSTNRILEQLE